MRWLVTLGFLTGIAAALLVAAPPATKRAGSYLDGIAYSHWPSANADVADVPSVGSLRGRVVDEAGLPVVTIRVELIPCDKSPDERWYATASDWTDAEGKYEFASVQPGEYFVAVHASDAPHRGHPFGPAFYPGVEQESLADRVLIIADIATELSPLNLKRLELETIKVSVVFEDGAVPLQSNLLFHNPAFSQGVIGGTAPAVFRGEAEFTLPKGYEYYARAKVDCDAGPRIETRESRPVHRIRVEDGQTPRELEFVIPGESCKLWRPPPSRE